MAPLLCSVGSIGDGCICLDGCCFSNNKCLTYRKSNFIGNHTCIWSCWKTSDSLCVGCKTIWTCPGISKITCKWTTWHLCSDGTTRTSITNITCYSTCNSWSSVVNYIIALCNSSTLSCSGKTNIVSTGCSKWNGYILTLNLLSVTQIPYCSTVSSAYKIELTVA